MFAVLCPVSHSYEFQSALSKERRELQQQQQRTLLEAIPKDLSRPWEDPMPEEGERHLAAVRGTTAAEQLPKEAEFMRLIK